MQQIIYRIPIKWGELFPDGIPLPGFGLMLFLAYFLCSALGGLLADKNGVRKQAIIDMQLMLFLFGILGARITFMIVEKIPIWSFFRIWEGGLIFYGSAFGGVAGYLVTYFWFLRKESISSWKIADIIAPALALGIGLGRIGCFLNGCCWGNVACAECPQVHFPLSAPPRYDLVRKGLQTPAGFLLAMDSPDGLTVQAVEPNSPAAKAGLLAGDRITKMDGSAVNNYSELEVYLVRDWPRGKNDLTLSVKRGQEELSLPSFRPVSLGLHPTQLYSSIGGFLLVLVLLTYWPLRSRDGAVMALLLLLYPIERFLEESLRNDTQRFDLGPWWPQLTLSQNISLFMLLGGVVLTVVLCFRPRRTEAALS